MEVTCGPSQNVKEFTDSRGIEVRKFIWEERCKELPLVPTAILNLGPPNFDVSESIGHFSLLVCNLPLVSYSTECFPWVSTVFWIRAYARELEQGMNRISTWIHGPYSSGGKARLWSQTNFSYKILVPSLFSSWVTFSKLFHFPWTFFFPCL